MPPADLIPALSHKEGTIPRPNPSRPMERYGEVHCDDIGRCRVGSGGIGRDRESNPSMIGWKTGDLSPGDLGFGHIVIIILLLVYCMSGVTLFCQ